LRDIFHDMHMAIESLALEAAFGKVIRVHREAMRLSQEGLADICGLHRTYISQLERGRKSPTLRVIVQLAKALQTQPESLVRQTFEGQS
jgi:transcriptional regulator with XRE-family HTH domain